MKARFNQSCKIQAVKNAFSRSGDTTLKEVADSLGVLSLHTQQVDGAIPPPRIRIHDCYRESKLTPYVKREKTTRLELGREA
jgi:hypothetical protein